MRCLSILLLFLNLVSGPVRAAYVAGSEKEPIQRLLAIIATENDPEVPIQVLFQKALSQLSNQNFNNELLVLTHPDHLEIQCKTKKSDFKIEDASSLYFSLNSLKEILRGCAPENESLQDINFEKTLLSNLLSALGGPSEFLPKEQMGGEKEEPKLVEYRIQKKIGYLKIPLFDSASLSAVDSALDAFMEADARGIIVDLRSNPGGILESAVAIANRFLPFETKIGSLKMRLETQDFVSNEPDRVAGVKVVVLVDGQTANSAELFAAALQDAKRAKIVGQPTLKSGKIQGVYPIPPHGFAKITIGQLLRPNGMAIDQGIRPDLMASGEKGWLEDPILERALKLF